MPSTGALLALLLALPAQHPPERPLALVGADVLPLTGATPIEGATVLVRDGRIQAVGVDLSLPFDVRAVDASGLTITAAFVDAAHHAELDFGSPEAQPGRPVDDRRDVLSAMLEANRRGITPEREVWRAARRDDADRAAHRDAGFGALLLAPSGMALSGTGAWVLPSGRPVREVLLAARAAQFGSLTWRSRPSDDYQGTDYPATLMGLMAHLRQTFLDAEHHDLLRERHASGAARLRPPRDPALEALAPVLRGELPLVLLAHEEEDIRLALGLRDVAPGLDLVVAGGREAWKLADELAAAGVGVVLDLDLPDEPADPDDEPARAPGKGVTVGQVPPPFRAEPVRLRRQERDRWLEQAAGADVLRKAGVAVAFGTFGRKPSELLEDVRLAIEPGGLARTDAFDVLTRGARAVFGPSAPVGEVVPGALAMLAAWEGDPLDEDARLALLVVDGVLFDHRDELARKPKKDRDAGGEAESEAESEAEEEGEEEQQQDAPPGTDEPEVVAEPAEPVAEEPREDPDAETPPLPEASRARHPYQVALAAALLAADVDVDWPVELDADREPSFRTGGDVLVRGGTLFDPAGGEVPGTDLLVRGGRVQAVGPDLPAPDGVVVVEAQGRYIVPGIIDCHAHIAIRGGVNEWTRSVTPEVTIADEVDPDDVGIYRALAGGTTAARLLHGSANAIGGRHEVVKLRWGSRAPGMVLEGAPAGVKFALGENPRQANWGDGGSRFPKTRMGVEATIRRAFEDGRRYAAGWARFAEEQAAGLDPDPPRRDLRLEALAGIVDGSIAVHSHCYRAHEIVMLLSLAEEFDLRVATFQHVLEGYKVGREIAAHGGLGGSTFVDWWGFKYEVEDAIPYNPALMHQAGVLVSVNSDSSDHIRRLHLEAAKVMKYGGVSERDALAMVTLNPALQLGLADRLGSLEVGKDADFALFSRHPFDTTTRCEMTFVDGELLFERRADAYDAWLDEVASRIVAGRAALETASEHLRVPSALERREREVDAGALAALSLPRDGTRAASTPARPPPEPVALVGGTLHTMDGRTIEGGTLLLREGLVEAVLEGAGDAADLAARGYRVHEVSGRHVWPGLIDGGGSVGLGEISLVRQSMDVGESSGDQPDLRASTAWHPASEVIPVTRVAGITTALAVPGGSGMRGQSSLMALEGWTVADALVRDAVALHVNAPRVRRDQPEGRGDIEEVEAHGHDLCLAGAPAPPPQDAPRGRPGKGGKKKEEDDAALAGRIADAWKEIRQALHEAREYARVAGEAEARGDPGPPYDPRLAALAPYALGAAPIVFEAQAADQIADVLDVAAAEGLAVIIGGGREAWKVADRLALADVPVLLGPVLALPSSRDEPYDAAYANAGLLHRAGVRFAFRSNESHSARDLPYHAAMAVAFGLPEEAALAALTSGVADILGLGDVLGRLAPGRRADVIVTDGSPLQITTSVQAVFIGGRDVGLQSKHTQLHEIYRDRLRDPGRVSPPR